VQEASGTDFIKLNWSAQLSSGDLSTDRGLHSFPCISFRPLIQTIVRGADALDGIFHGRRPGVPLPPLRPYLHRIAGFPGESSAMIRKWTVRAIDSHGTAR